MSPFEISKLGFSDDVLEPDTFTALVMTLVGLALCTVGYIFLITDVSPLLGGSYWYALSAATPVVIIAVFELLVPVFTTRPPICVAFLCTVIAPGFVVVWVPWVAAWLVWRTVTAVPIMRARRAWTAYWVGVRERRNGAGVPVAVVRTRSER